MEDILAQDSVIAIVAMGQKVFVLTRGIDLSVESNSANCTEENAASGAQDLLTKTPKLKAIYAACSRPRSGPCDRRH